eukprot:TRINITY_DN7518_c0_g1_i1.p1 TRINITY_DN7518_c0_g1~~TRINITY_DN7518_c0_g1_i1.p1  ORF type:complete len:497 (+),score=160.57 TRINITY_DN7518_c0_g1_i1:97-1491(+)
MADGMDAAHIRRLFCPNDCFAAGRALRMDSCGGYDRAHQCLAAYSVVGGCPEQAQLASQKLAELRAARGGRELTPDEAKLDRSLGCMLGNIVGDALGAPLEFSPVRYGVQELTGMDHDQMWQKADYNAFRLQPGQWTDDGSMALCLADSLLCGQSEDGVDALDLRQRFHAWNKFGYNNAFGRDPGRVRGGGAGSVGLGGNISMSIAEWTQHPLPATRAGNKWTSGNGSVMRNGAVPVWFRDDVEKGMRAAHTQSKTTHGGDEAAELCRLITFICTRFINGATRSLLDNLSEFSCPLYTVTCLRDARCEEKHPENSDPIFGGLENRRWNWRTPDFHHCEFRAQQQPGYVGSYAMDAVSMALHCVHSTRGFDEALLKCANMRGDSDSVCAVTGQIAGALYGATAIPPSWLARVAQWDGGSIAARALLLHEHKRVPPSVALSDAACASAKQLGCPLSQDRGVSPAEA